MATTTTTAPTTTLRNGQTVTIGNMVEFDTPAAHLTGIVDNVRPVTVPEHDGNQVIWTATGRHEFHVTFTNGDADWTQFEQRGWTVR